MVVKKNVANVGIVPQSYILQEFLDQMNSTCGLDGESNCLITSIYPTEGDSWHAEAEGVMWILIISASSNICISQIYIISASSKQRTSRFQYNPNRKWKLCLKTLIAQCFTFRS
jgi:hypothetical protein